MSDLCSVVHSGKLQCSPAVLACSSAVLAQHQSETSDDVLRLGAMAGLHMQFARNTCGQTADTAGTAVALTAYCHCSLDITQTGHCPPVSSSDIWSIFHLQFCWNLDKYPGIYYYFILHDILHWFKANLKLHWTNCYLYFSCPSRGTDNFSCNPIEMPWLGF